VTIELHLVGGDQGFFPGEMRRIDADHMMRIDAHHWGANGFGGSITYSVYRITAPAVMLWKHNTIGDLDVVARAELERRQRQPAHEAVVDEAMGPVQPSSCAAVAAVRDRITRCGGVPTGGEVMARLRRAEIRRLQLFWLEDMHHKAPDWWQHANVPGSC
jgi:hypothetical protein